MPFLEARGIVKSYPVGDTSLTVLRDLDLQVEAGEMVAIVGASGVGKSTLLHVLGGLDRVDQGDIAIDGASLTALADADVVAFRNQPRRLRVPVSSSPAGVQRARERRDADADRADADGRGAAARRGAAAPRRARRAARRTGPGCCRAASSSASRSRAR